MGRGQGLGRTDIILLGKLKRPTSFLDFAMANLIRDIWLYFKGCVTVISSLLSYLIVCVL